MLNMSLSTSSIEILLNVQKTCSVNCSNDSLVISRFIALSSKLHLIRQNKFLLLLRSSHPVPKEYYHIATNVVFIDFVSAPHQPLQ